MVLASATTDPLERVEQIATDADRLLNATRLAARADGETDLEALLYELQFQWRTAFGAFREAVA